MGISIKIGDHEGNRKAPKKEEKHFHKYAGQNIRSCSIQASDGIVNFAEIGCNGMNPLGK